GAVNPATGVFRANAPVSFFSFGDCLESIGGTAAPHGNSFSGTALIMCSGSVTLVPPLAVTALRCPPGEPCCGNGIVEPGEVCDDQVCCDASCQVPVVGCVPLRCVPGEPCCGNGIVEPGEVCDDQVCCDASCQVPVVDCVRDHYLCYRVGLAAGQPDFTPVQKTLEDRFGTLVFDVIKLE